MLISICCFEFAAISFYFERKSKAALVSNKCTFPKSGQNKQIQKSPIFDQGEIYHRLPHFFLAVGTFHLVSLIYDINKVLGFRYPPKYFADPYFKVIISFRKTPDEFSEIEMCPFRIKLINPDKWSYDQPLIAVTPLKIIFGIKSC